LAKIAFVQEELRERFGIMMLSSELKEHGHEREVFIESSNEAFRMEVIAWNPDIIAFSTMTPGIAFAEKNIKFFKENTNALIVMGGAHPTFYPEVIFETPVDVICRGEGQEAMVELADAIEQGESHYKIANLWARDKCDKNHIHKNDVRPICDINTHSNLDFDLYYAKFQELADAPTKRVFLGKGCPFDCTYCFNHSMKKLYKGKGKYTQYMDVKKAIKEIISIRDKYGMKWLLILTDAVNIERKWFMDFLEEYKQKVKIPFICNVRIDRVDEEMVKAMKEAGCDRVNYGIEHGNYEIRKNILKRNMPDDVIIKAGQLFTKYKIRVQTANIIGVPHETVETIMETVRLNRKVKPKIAQGFILQPFPGTEIHKYAAEHGLLPDDNSYSKSGTGFQASYFAEQSFPLKLKDKCKLLKMFYLFNLFCHTDKLDFCLKLMLVLPFTRLYKLIYMWPLIHQMFKYAKDLQERVKALRIFVKIMTS